MLRCPGRPPPRLPVAAAVLGGCLLQIHGVVAAGNNASHLSRGQIVGVVLGSVGCALLLGLLTVACCCLWRSARRRHTADLTWAKHPDLESVTAPHAAPHVPLPGAAGDEAAAASAPRASGGGGDGCRLVLPVAVAAGDELTPLEAAAVAAAFQQGGQGAPKLSARSGRSSGGGSAVVHFLMNRKTLGGTKRFTGLKEKNLEVSRSARVEPSAELEMTIPLDTAATNHGPPLSKSSMLLRWLQGAEGDSCEAVAVAALAAASGGGATTCSMGGASLRGSLAVSGGGGGGVDGMFSDRLPLLSLAAQQSGIVWSKMPPSVASSPAVSVTEGSLSRHMLKGTMKRSDAPDSADSATGGGGHEGSAAADGCDDRYPASLRRASVDSLSLRQGAAVQRPGIVFDHVMPVPGSARSSTVSGRGGALDLPAAGHAGPAVKAAGGLDGVTGVVVASLARTSVGRQQGRLEPVPAAGQDGAARTAAWLHQLPPTQLSALQEEEGAAEEEEEAPTPLRRAPSLTMQASGRQLQPMPVSELLPPSAALPMAAMGAPLSYLSPVASYEPPHPPAPVLPPGTRRSASDVTAAALAAQQPAPATGSAPGNLADSDSGEALRLALAWQSAQGNRAQAPPAANQSVGGGELPYRVSSASSRATAPTSTSPPSPFLPAPPPTTGAPATAPGAEGDRRATSDGGILTYVGKPPANPPSVPVALKHGYHQHHPSDVTLALGLGSTGAPASLDASESGEAAAACAGSTDGVASRRRQQSPLVLRASMSGSSRSPSAVSPSMGVHFPELPDSWRRGQDSADGANPVLPASVRGGPMGRGVTLSKSTAQMEEEHASASFLGVREGGVSGAGSGGGNSSSGGGSTGPGLPKPRPARGSTRGRAGAWARPASPVAEGLGES